MSDRFVFFAILKCFSTMYCIHIDVLYTHFFRWLLLDTWLVFCYAGHCINPTGPKWTVLTRKALSLKINESVGAKLASKLKNTSAELFLLH